MMCLIHISTGIKEPTELAVQAGLLLQLASDKSQ